MIENTYHVTALCASTCEDEDSLGARTSTPILKFGPGPAA
jgi:hypothetical protein